MQEIPDIAAASAPFTIMTKPVGPICNLNCGYCYYIGKERYYEGAHSFKMTDALLETFIRQYIEASPGPAVQFTWHGGEPALAGLEFYRRAVALQKKYLPEGWSCWNNLQTNGVLLNDDWCAFLAENRFDVGLSVDGTQWLHDRYRRDRNGGGTYDNAVAAVRRLQAHGIQPDLLCTVNSATEKEPLAVYRALKNLNTGWLQFIPVVYRTEDGQVAPESATPKGYGDFLCDIFDEWILHDIGKTEVQLFAETAMVLNGGAAALCWMAPTCGRAIIVEHDGGVYACDHFVDPEHRIGSIETAHIGALVDSEEQVRFGNAKRDNLPAQCRACSCVALCNGGCPKDRFMTTSDGEPGLNYLCEGLHRFFTHAEKSVIKVTQLRKRGLTAEAIMAELRAEEAERWKGIGRNDPCPCGSGRKAKNCCWDKRP